MLIWLENRLATGPVQKAGTAIGQYDQRRDSCASSRRIWRIGSLSKQWWRRPMVKVASMASSRMEDRERALRQTRNRAVCRCSSRRFLANTRVLPVQWLLARIIRIIRHHDRIWGAGRRRSSTCGEVRLTTCAPLLAPGEKQGVYAGWMLTHIGPCYIRATEVKSGRI
jgi:hypothetical protein